MEFNMAGVPQLACPDQWHIGQVTPCASRFHKGEFEFRPVKIGFGGNHERSAVVFRAAHDDERSVDRASGNLRPKKRESRNASAGEGLPASTPGSRP